ncbi:MAG: DUF3997 domain-containing protein [Cyclobacteriaceae bacterium]
MIARISFITTLSIISFTLTGCFGLFDSSSDTIVGPYKVMWIDLPEQQFICQQSEQYSTSFHVLVPEYVFAVGHDDNFIIAKQHPTAGFEDDFKIDASVTQYYIIDTNVKSEATGAKVFGPLTKAEFDSKRKEFRIEGIKFELAYADVP